MYNLQEYNQSIKIEEEWANLPEFTHLNGNFVDRLTWEECVLLRVQNILGFPLADLMRYPITVHLCEQYTQTDNEHLVFIDHAIIVVQPTIVGGEFNSEWYNVALGFSPVVIEIRPVIVEHRRNKKVGELDDKTDLVLLSPSRVEFDRIDVSVDWLSQDPGVTAEIRIDSEYGQIDDLKGLVSCCHLPFSIPLQLS